MSIVERIDRHVPKNGDLFIVTVRNLNDKRRMPLFVQQLQGLFVAWQSKGIDADVLVFDRHADFKLLTDEEKDQLYELLIEHKAKRVEVPPVEVNTDVGGGE